MHRYAVVVFCFISLLASQVHGQKATLEPIHIAAGSVLTFHLQTRLNPGDRNETDALPKGTLIRVRLLDTVNSDMDRDGSEFHGAVVSSVVSGNEIIVHSHSEVRGLFALLRSRNHPEGFRYELLITRVIDHGKSYDLTASLNPSFFDDGSQHEQAVESKTLNSPRDSSASTSVKSPVQMPN